MDYYRHYMNGSMQVVHTCDICDEKDAVFFTDNAQLCRECHADTE